MAPPYDFKIFISYAWVDNARVLGLGVGWVNRLIGGLDQVIAQKVGRSGLVSILMDIRGEQSQLTSEILSKVQESASLLIFLSPGYLTSEWCLRELYYFLQTFPDPPPEVIEFLEAKKEKITGVAPGDTNGKSNPPPKRVLKSIFVVEIARGKKDLRPPILGEIISIRFWREDEHKIPYTLGKPEVDLKDTIYYRLLEQLGGSIVSELERLKGGPLVESVF